MKPVTQCWVYETDPEYGGRVVCDVIEYDADVSEAMAWVRSTFQHWSGMECLIRAGYRDDSGGVATFPYPMNKGTISRL